MKNPDSTVSQLLESLPGPDFPTAGLIHGVQGVISAYNTGRGRIYVRARTHLEPIDKRGREALIVTELPYQVNKARLIEKIAELVREKRLEGITELRDESDKDGMRVVIELRKGEIAEVVLNNLYKQTSLQSVFGINMVGLVDGQPRLLSLKELLEVFLRHRREIVTRRTLYDLRKAKEQAHILEGQMVALENIDDLIALIKKSASPAKARISLMEQAWPPGVAVKMVDKSGSEDIRPEGIPASLGLTESGYRFSEAQARAILDLRLHRLTALEQDKILNSYEGLIENIKRYLQILSNPEELVLVIRGELTEIREAYADSRCTEIVEDYTELTDEDLIPEEDVVVTISHGGYAKAQPVGVYQAQRRGGRGRAAAKVKGEDFIDQLFIANSHDTLLCFSSLGKVYWLKVYQVPRASPGARGRPIVNLLPLTEEERINAVVPVQDFDEDRFVMFATSQGTVKKTPLHAFSRPRSNGIIAVDLRTNDRLIGAAITDGARDIMLFARSGKAIRFAESNVRPMGRTAAGVRGLRLAGEHDAVIALGILGQGLILTATENGYGKRTPIEDFHSQGRGGKGVIAIQTSERNGQLIGALQVSDDNEVMLISSSGTLVRTPVADISTMGRNTQGVKLIRLDEGDRLVGLERVEILQEQQPG